MIYARLWVDGSCGVRGRGDRGRHDAVAHNDDNDDDDDGAAGCWERAWSGAPCRSSKRGSVPHPSSFTVIMCDVKRLTCVLACHQERAARASQVNFPSSL
eukprot:1169663-Rhodomonas_salina.2